MSDYPSTLRAADGRPEHRIHNTSDKLPGARGTAPAVADYSVGTMERSNSDSSDTRRRGGLSVSGTEPQIHRASSIDRPLDPQPSSTRAVSVGGQEQHASMTDKIIGKTQKFIGKHGHKAELQEKGELREAGGKAAVQSQGAAHT